MKIINRERGSGKSTMLLYSAIVTDYPIITLDCNTKEHLRLLEKENGINGATIYTLDEWERIKPVCGNVLIDELGLMLSKIVSKYLYTNVVVATMSEPMAYLSNKKEQKNGRLLLESDVIKAVDEHIGINGALDDDISCILEKIKSR